MVVHCGQTSLPNPKKSDVVLVDRLVVLLELTCPFDSSAASFQASYDRKNLRYKRLALHCQNLGFETHNMPLEIGSRGVVNARNQAVLATLSRICKIRNMKTSMKTWGRFHW